MPVSWGLHTLNFAAINRVPYYLFEVYVVSFVLTLSMFSNVVLCYYLC